MKNIPGLKKTRMCIKKVGKKTISVLFFVVFHGKMGNSSAQLVTLIKDNRKNEKKKKKMGSKDNLMLLLLKLKIGCILASATEETISTFFFW